MILRHSTNVGYIQSVIDYNRYEFLVMVRDGEELERDGTRLRISQILSYSKINSEVIEFLMSSGDTITFRFDSDRIDTVITDIDQIVKSH